MELSWAVVSWIWRVGLAFTLVILAILAVDAALFVLAAVVP